MGACCSARNHLFLEWQCVWYYFAEDVVKIQSRHVGIKLGASRWEHAGALRASALAQPSDFKNPVLSPTRIDFSFLLCFLLLFLCFVVDTIMDPHLNVYPRSCHWLVVEPHAGGERQRIEKKRSHALGGFFKLPYVSEFVGVCLLLLLQRSLCGMSGKTAPRPHTSMLQLVHANILPAQ